MFGLSDAGAHCGQICDGSMTTSFMTMWARDREGDDHIPLESVVHQITRRPAEHFGWLDRGLVAPGLLADLNVIDFENLRLRATGVGNGPSRWRAPLPPGSQGLPLDREARRGDV
jgi:N-acyl-D-aspartate/D-glutamate deacylase